ncbi:MAG: hypothetical protein REI94_02320 [Moraxellaceae bacterium]|nr:hypothetical protein [Moraxellaceae bacterium]
MQVFFIQYEVRPLPDSDHFEGAGGAYANCLVRAASGDEAAAVATSELRDSGWEIVALEEGPLPVHRQDYLDAAPEWLEAFDAAVEDGASFALHTWPNEAQEDDVLH